MPRAVLKGGVFHPVEPIPAEWAEGHEVRVEDAEPMDPERIEAWYRDMQVLTSGFTPADEDQLKRALAEIRREGKERSRREMGLPR